MLTEILQKGTKDIVFVYTTCSSIEEARSIGLGAINKKLAISADFWIIGSIYPWHGVIQEVDQYMLMLTTEKGLGDKLTKWVEGMHSYSTPMIAKSDNINMSPNYKFWANMTLSSKSEYLSEDEAKKKKEYEEEGDYHYGKLK